MKLYLKSIIIIAIITLVGVGGFFGWKYMNAPKKAASPTQELTAEDLLAQSFDTEEITTNFKDGGFIKTKFKIVTTSKDNAENLKKLEFRFESSIIQYINEIDKESVNGPEGIPTLENNVKKELNKGLKDELITRVYVIDKIVQ